jgi:DNA mismatch repair protein MutL
VKERLLYDDYMSMLGQGSMASQKLLFPEELTLSEDDFQLLAEHEVEFAALGFDMTLKDDCRVVLGGVPASVVGEQADTLLYDLLHEVGLQGDAKERMRSDMARVMAYRASRLQQGITEAEAQDMLSRLGKCENYSFTPSGKSIMAEITLEELKSKLS